MKVSTTPLKYSSISEYLRTNLTSLKTPEKEYKDVFFCPVYWKGSSDLAMKDDIEKLTPVFRKRLGAKVFEIILPDSKPRLAFNRKLTDLEEFNHQESLDMTVAFEQVNLCFGDKNADILYLLDFCYSGLVMKGREAQTIEMIAACGIDETVPHGLFASAIINQLNSMKSPMVVMKLHQLLIQSIKKQYGATPIHGMLKGNSSIRLGLASDVLSPVIF